MRALAALLLFVAQEARARPAWADAPDTADPKGHTFTCEGMGPTEEEALAAAQAICNDKICKVCGVEVESTVETRETLKGVDMQRKVIERCRRVRKSETKVKFKSTDCGPEGCTAWVQIFYSKQDEAAECPGYAKDDFADPAQCEKNIDAFSKLEGRTAASFHERRKLLDAALAHCEKIDVRPTPALMALDAKLAAGMDQYEFTREMQDRTRDEWSRPWWASYLSTYAPLRKSIAESKLLTERIRLARDLVANKALVFDVIEAVRADDLATAAGVERVYKAIQRAPPGAQYGAPKIHFTILFGLRGVKADTRAIGDFMRATYPPDKIEGGESFELALYFKSDGKTSEEEWDYVMRAHQARRCDACLLALLRAREHGSAEVRTARFFLALRSLPAGREPFAQFKKIAPHDDAAFLLALEDKLPPEVQSGYRWDFFEELMRQQGDYTPREEKAALHARALRGLEQGNGGEDPRKWCEALPGRMETFEKRKAPAGALPARVCECLTGALREGSVRDGAKSDLYERALDDDLPCVSAASAKVIQ